MGTGTHSPSATCTMVGCTVIMLYAGGSFIGLKLKGFSVRMSAEGGGVACPWLWSAVTPITAGLGREAEEAPEEEGPREASSSGVAW